MGEAFDAACKGLRDTGQPIVVQEVIAKRIIKAAMKGERYGSLARRGTSRFGIRQGSDLGAGRSCAVDHKSRRKMGPSSVRTQDFLGASRLSKSR